MKSPCYDVVNHKDCPGRHEGCAVDCPAWAEYVRARDEEYRQRRIKSEVDQAYYAGITRCKTDIAKRDMLRRRSRRRHHS